MKKAELELVIETIPNAVVVVDKNGNITFANHAAETTFGLSQAEIKARAYNAPVWKITSLEGKPFPEEELPFVLVMKHKKPFYGIEHAIKRPDGKRIILSINASPLLDEKGNVESVLISFSDITDRKMIEKECLANLHFFESMERVSQAISGTKNLEQMMSNVLGEALTILDCDRASLVYPCDPEALTWSAPMERTKPEWPGALILGVEIPMDPEVARIFKVSRAANGPVKFGPGYEEPLPVEVAEQFNIQSQMTLALYPKIGKPWNFVIHQCSYPRVWTPDEERLFEAIGRRIADALSILLFYRDLRESEEKYRRIVDTANEGILLLGPDNIITFLNTRMAEMLGLTPEEMLGHSSTDFMFDEDIPDFLQKIEDRKKGMSETFERRYRHKDGKPIWALASATPVFDNENHYIGAFGMFTDITERKRAEEELRIHRDHLTELVKERTTQLEIANKRLRQEIGQVIHLQQTIEDQLSMLQQALVPPAPRMIAGYQSATIYLPAYQGQNIGGDLFDVFTTETGKIGVLIGDVSGKGVEAAALAASARSTVHSFTYELDSPDDAMYHTNAVLQSQISGTKNFITMFLAVIDPSTGMINYSRAGHPPAAILRRDGDVEFLREGELPIGLFAGIKYGLFENYLEPGDKIILYTDGITEARCDGKFFDLEGVERTLASFRGASLEEVVNGLIEEARKWSKDNLQDDIAILAIERAEDEQGL